MSPRRHNGGTLHKRTFKQIAKTAPVTTHIFDNTDKFQRKQQDLQLPFLAISHKDRTLTLRCTTKRARCPPCCYVTPLQRMKTLPHLKLTVRLAARKKTTIQRGVILNGRMRSVRLVLSDVALGQRTSCGLFTGLQTALARLEE